MQVQEIRKKLIDLGWNQSDLYNRISDDIDYSYSTFNSFLTGRAQMPSVVAEAIRVVFSEVGVGDLQ